MKLTLMLMIATVSVTPLVAQKLKLEGKASYYGRKHHGRIMSNGDRFDMNLLTCAHRSLPFGTVLEVTRLDTEDSVEVVVTDRGPKKRSRIIDLSAAAAKSLNFIRKGIIRVKLRVVE